MAITKTNNRMIDGSVVNVLDYGADNTGAVDAKTAIQSAIDAGNKIYMPAGTYRIDSSVLLKDNTHIFGDGIDATIVQEAGNSDDFTTSLFINENYNNTTGNDNIIVSDISFKGKNNTPITDGTVASNNKGIGGVYLGYCINSAITNCVFRDGWSGFVITETQTGFTGATNIRIENCVVFNSTSWSQNGEVGKPRGFNLGTKAVKATNCACYGSATGFYINADLGVFNGLYSIDWNADNGFYIIGDFQKFSNCVADGNNFGSGFAISYSYGSEYNNCIAQNCGNMGFRLHAPQSDTRFANISSYDSGYCIRTENTTTYTPTSVTSSAGVVTVTLAVDAADNRFRANDAVYIEGVNEAGYNGVWKIESVSGNTLTYKSADAVTSPATGTIVVRHAVSNLQFDNVLVDNPTIDTIEISKADNIQFNNVTVKSNSNGYGMDIEDCKNLTVNNSTFYDTKDQAIDVFRSENVTIDNINVHNCNTDAGTGATERGAIRIKSVVGVSITNVKGTSPSAYFIYQDGLNEGSSPSSGYIKNNKRTDDVNNDWSYAGVHYEHVGTGTPEGNVVSGIGAIYYRQDGGAGTTLYIKESGTGNTGWVAK
jgi:polygalacturonase